MASDLKKHWKTQIFKYLNIQIFKIFKNIQNIQKKYSSQPPSSKFGGRVSVVCKYDRAHSTNSEHQTITKKILFVEIVCS